PAGVPRAARTHLVSGRPLPRPSRGRCDLAQGDRLDRLLKGTNGMKGESVGGLPAVRRAPQANFARPRANATRAQADFGCARMNFACARPVVACDRTWRVSRATWNRPGANPFRLRAKVAALRASSVCLRATANGLRASRFCRSAALRRLRSKQ